MKRRPWFLWAAAVLMGLAAGPSARADLFAPGATLQVTYTDPATSTQHTEIVPFNPGGAPASLDGGALQISEQTLVVNSTTEWVQFALTTTGGGKLDTQSGGYFSVNFNNVQLTEAAGWISNFLAFTLNGQTSGDPFFGHLVTDPVTPSAGKVDFNGPYGPLTNSPFFGSVFFPNPPAAFYEFQTPYGGYLSLWGVNPNVNGFLAGVELQAAQPFPSTVPEPSTLALLTVGLFGLAGGAWWRRKRST